MIHEKGDGVEKDVSGTGDAPLLYAENIRVQRDGLTILQGLDFQLDCGEILGIQGESGAGKSTLLRLLNRLDDADGGEIHFHGKDLRSYSPPELRRRIAMVFQRPAVVSGTVRDNLKMIEAYSGQILTDEICSDMLGRVNLSPALLSRNASALSGGEIQRLALARTLLNRPEVILLDEPTASLDARNRETVLNTLAEILSDEKLAAILVTHNRDDVLRLQGRTLHLENGCLTADN